jgi:nitroreductase
MVSDGYDMLIETAMNSKNQRNDQLLDALNWRYATKTFDKTKQISAADWETLMQALRLAPSSFGLQPWKFIEVTSSEIRKKLRQAAWNQPQVEDASKLLVLTAKRTMGASDVELWMAELATQRKVPVKDLSGYKQMILGFLSARPGDNSLPERTARQVYLALGFLLSSAALVEFDACPMEGFIQSQVDEILQLTGSEFTSIVLCPMGYRSQEDAHANMPKVRYPLSKIIEVR